MNAHLKFCPHPQTSMRLLNTTTLLLEEFIGDNIPGYAILSHRWENEEVTFQDLREGRGPNMPGYSKITGCCRQARLDGWKYAWVDSCCIDKTSSAELSEAINSMFKWYKDSQVCYVYLSDVKCRSGFGRSQWFTRGWTLQELLAPEFLIFFDKNWKDIDTKLRLLGELSSITGISTQYLADPEGASVAQIMSWASARHTTRIEDQAYCLMGLFGIHMRPLYGEGNKAFLRLQLEILRTSDDETIFAWRSEIEGEKTGGLLAKSAASFKQSSNIIRCKRISRDGPSYGMTNKGLRIQGPFLPTSEKYQVGHSRIYLMPVNCTRVGSTSQLLVLYVVDLGDHSIRITDRDLLYLCEDEWRPPNLRNEEAYFRQRSEEYDHKVIYITVNLISQPEYRIKGMATIVHGERSWRTYKDPISTISFKSNCYGSVAVAFRGEFVASFVLVLVFTHQSPLVEMICPEDGLPAVGREWEYSEHERSLDRVSRLLSSGASVSYQMRRRRGVQQSLFHRTKEYVIDVSIDPQGSLPWPQPRLPWANTPLEIRGSSVDLDIQSILKGVDPWKGRRFSM
ncbi:hypothetical protein ONS95_005881 [Cadophora gregata]|uniref:uncharacterized protein n=1 Tax=Cadophora gregata TaxID=51156 RepID=UPI0026DBCCE7|nr:uncharacterized protein ONS95_005881 [Cadophora gregata]KAK0102259.1 hypothetical protein ONS95_005881 [Cadophora gregata]